ncbi:hypothetical protein BX661DRAFT_200575 [Kickxella alabastrina]|uniref:uncharacterized protein n=1 Tax=Kickxella alabastrina TaxID=61397 RepID=UPI002220E3A9|nr:uncharacterized protein BX661DRAFT_200575 [Kickxella alabastrina]KAI7821810.1 hypothetical protein BX661DRAFT_200575 [Kickxella alabastrina]
MTTQLLQALRLPSLALQRSQLNRRAKERDRGRTRAPQPLHSPAQLNTPGLNLVFPACPSCTHKVTHHHKGAAKMNWNDTARAQSRQWECQSCCLYLKEQDVSWTYRISLTLANVVSTTGGSSSSMKEVSVSILGPAADVLFGCTAAQWVEAVDRTVEALENSTHSICAAAATLAERMADQLAALVDISAGVLDPFMIFECKQISNAYARSNTNQCNVSRMSRTSVCKELAEIGGPPLIHLWQMVAFGALSAELGAARAEQILGLGFAAAFKNVCVADIISAAPIFPFCDPGTGTLAADQFAIDMNIEKHLDCDAIFQLWRLDRADQCASTIRAWEHTTSAQQISSIIDNDDLDDLFDHCSQLLLSNNNSAVRPEARSANTSDPLLSAQLLDESRYDEYLHNLFIDSQQGESTLSQQPQSVGSNSSSGTNESVLFDAGIPYDCDLSALLAMSPFMCTNDSILRSPCETPAAAASLSAFEQTLESTLRELHEHKSQPTTSHRATMLAAAPVFARTISEGAQRTPTRKGRFENSGSAEPVILAQETPVAEQHSPVRKRSRIIVCETPAALQRTLSLNSVPRSKRSPSNNTPSRTNSNYANCLVVPETLLPASSTTRARKVPYVKPQRTKVESTLRVGGVNKGNANVRPTQPLSWLGRQLSLSVKGSSGNRSVGYAQPPRPSTRPSQKSHEQPTVSALEAPAGRQRTLKLVKRGTSNSTSDLLKDKNS